MAPARPGASVPYTTMETAGALEPPPPLSPPPLPAASTISAPDIVPLFVLYALPMAHAPASAAEALRSASIFGSPSRPTIHLSARSSSLGLASMASFGTPATSLARGSAPAGSRPRAALSAASASSRTSRTREVRPCSRLCAEPASALRTPISSISSAASKRSICVPQLPDAPHTRAARCGSLHRPISSASVIAVPAGTMILRPSDSGTRFMASTLNMRSADSGAPRAPGIPAPERPARPPPADPSKETSSKCRLPPHATYSVPGLPNQLDPGMAAARRPAVEAAHCSMAMRPPRWAISSPVILPALVSNSAFAAASSRSASASTLAPSGTCGAAGGSVVSTGPRRTLPFPSRSLSFATTTRVPDTIAAPTMAPTCEPAATISLPMTARSSAAMTPRFRSSVAVPHSGSPRTR